MDLILTMSGTNPAPNVGLFLLTAVTNTDVSPIYKTFKSEN